ncbi:MAG: NAD(P)-dependent oxidoreductase [Candidatus Levybacteria bacterium]|nr:NAD(P)-dependent oxidoreductase [Candidatus Levybacteria bacterium]
MKPHVLITGGCGFLGVHLARLLLKKDFTVTLFDQAPLDAKDLIGKVIVIKGDIRKKKDITQAMKGISHVIHAAAALPIQRTKQKIFSVNVDGTKRVVDAAYEQKVKRLVFISTTALYGVPKHLPETEESPLEPIGYYGQSKLIGEQICKEYMEKGLPINIIRPKTFLGPERLGVFSLWFEAIYTGRRVFILGKGNNKYQLLAVSDVADAIHKALVSSVKNEIFNIGAREYQTWRKDLKTVIRYDKSVSKITGLPVLPTQIALRILEWLHLSPLAAWHYMTMPVPSYVSIQKAQDLLYWQPKKSNKELLLESYLWYKKNRTKIQKRTGDTHRVGWDFQILNLISKI